MIRVGNQSAYSAHPLTLPFEFAIQKGFDAFEWFPDKRGDGAGWVASDLGPPQRQTLRKQARDAGISLSVHAPVHTDPLRESTHKDLEDSLRLGVDLGASLLNIHFSDPRRCQEFTQAVLPWAQRCQACGLKLAIENTPVTSPEDFNRLFSLVQHPSVGMCLDIGHANLYPGTHNDYISYVDRLRPEVPILHVHLHENFGESDSHLVLFTGPAGKDPIGIVALLDRLDRRGFEGNGILEQWPQPAELLAQARDKLLDLVRTSKG
jgi:sugar phosphate isomerase/epimerase